MTSAAVWAGALARAAKGALVASVAAGAGDTERWVVGRSRREAETEAQVSGHPARLDRTGAGVGATAVAASRAMEVSEAEASESGLLGGDRAGGGSVATSGARCDDADAVTGASTGAGGGPAAAAKRRWRSEQVPWASLVASSCRMAGCSGCKCLGQWQVAASMPGTADGR
ncbi:hypothetical protein ACJRO7_010961 [Eucalyptus globulus]|uniref:Uncharacterized protein n=1 Tax=Eucalyptus globulus TaxID=34317 RepID=A0ABD3LJ56_EUCGL